MTLVCIYQIHIISSHTTTSGITFLGISNAIGRIAAGSMGNIRRLNPLHVNNISLIVAGITLILIGLVCNSVVSLLCAVSLFGYSVGR